MPKSLIQLENVSVTRSGSCLLHVADWNLEPGMHWAICGVNGSGKSTFLRLLRGEITPDPGGGRFYDFGEGMQDSVLGLRHRIGLVSADMQDFYVLHGEKVTGREIILAGFFDTPLLYEAPEPEHERAGDVIISGLGLEDIAKMTAGSMSTGQLRRVLLARALAGGPDVLLLDECLEGLDTASREAVLNMVEQAATMTTLVIAAHSLEDLPSCMKRALVIESGKVWACGNMEIARAFFASTPRGEHCELTTISPEPMEGFMFRIRNASVMIQGKFALNDISWEMLPGQNWAVLGHNGAGKTTLLRMLMSEVAPYAEEGTVEWFGGIPFDQVRPGVGLVSQELQSHYASEFGRKPNVLETVLSGYGFTVGLYEEPGQERIDRAHEVMRFMGLDGMDEMALRNLSYGQQRRVFIARAVAFGPRLLLLDEPLSGLDSVTRAEVLPLLQGLAAGGTPTVLVTHHREHVFDAITHVLVLDKGRVSFCGTRQEWENSDF